MTKIIKTGMKYCPGMPKKGVICGEWKPLDEFHLNKTSKDGRQYYCKVCRSKLDKIRNQELIEKEAVLDKDKQQKLEVGSDAIIKVDKLEALLFGNAEGITLRNGGKTWEIKYKDHESMLNDLPMLIEKILK